MSGRATDTAAVAMAATKAAIGHMTPRRTGEIASVCVYLCASLPLVFLLFLIQLFCCILFIAAHRPHIYRRCSGLVRQPARASEGGLRSTHPRALRLVLPVILHINPESK